MIVNNNEDTLIDKDLFKKYLDTTEINTIIDIGSGSLPIINWINKHYSNLQIIATNDNNDDNDNIIKNLNNLYNSEYNKNNTNLQTTIVTKKQ